MKMWTGECRGKGQVESRGPCDSPFNPLQPFSQDPSSINLLKREASQVENRLNIYRYSRIRSSVSMLYPSSGNKYDVAPSRLRSHSKSLSNYSKACRPED